MGSSWLAAIRLELAAWRLCRAQEAADRAIVGALAAAATIKEQRALRREVRRAKRAGLGR